MKITVLGLWHLGLVTSSCLARLGHQVTGLDFDKDLIKELQESRTPLFEPGLNDLISEQIKEYRLTFSWDAKETIKDAQVLWFAIDTPINEKDEADILFLEDHFKKIMPYLNKGTAIVFSSQAPVGFVSHMEKIFVKKYPRKKCYFASSPENLKLGRAIDAFLNPDRIIIGVNNKESKNILCPLFASITDRLEWMKIESAEMTKHAINSFLATSVCFANEIAAICEQTGANAKEVERGLKTEARIGPKAYLKPGLAFSGGTLARDIIFLTNLSNKYKLASYLIKNVSKSNSYHKGWIKRKCLQLLKSLKGKTVAILGLTYKPGTDTLRRSFAVELARSFNSQGARVIAFDPAIKSIPKHLAKIIDLKHSIEGTVPVADVIIIAVECREFLRMSEAMIKTMKNKILIDPNGFLEKLVEHNGINYFLVGGK